MMFDSGGVWNDRYWRIFPDPTKHDYETELERAGRGDSNVTRKQRRLIDARERERVLRNKYVRMQLELPEYSRCEVTELRKFVRERKLGFEETGELSKQQLVNMLEQADCRPRFRFRDLPPELQTMVYQHYIKDFQYNRPRSLRAPAIPPLAHASRSLKQDVLPLFYATTPFYLGFHHHFTGRPPAAIGRFDLTRETRSWLAKLSEANLARMSSFELHRPGNTPVVVLIDLRGKGQAEWAGIDPLDDAGYNKSDLDAMLERLRCWAGKVDKHKLKMEDIDALKVIMEG